MTAVIRFSATEARLILPGLKTVVYSAIANWHRENDPVVKRLHLVVNRLKKIEASKTGELRLEVRDLVALQFAVRIGLEMVRYGQRQPFLEDQTERGRRLIAKLEKYHKRLRRRLGIRGQAWRHPLYNGWPQLRADIRCMFSFGRRPTAPWLPMWRLVGHRKLRKLRKLVEQYGGGIWDLLDEPSAGPAKHDRNADIADIKEAPALPASPRGRNPSASQEIAETVKLNQDL